MNKNYYQQYYHFERSHWWFLARNQIVESLVDKIAGEKKLSILNVGVSTGATSLMLERFGDVTSVEYDEDCCIFLRDKVNIPAIQASLTDLPFADNSFDLVCAFDVIEHIEDDSKALTEVRRVLKEDGNYFITVPAFQFLWGEHDLINHHFRRYTLPGLRKKIELAGLGIEYKTYFNSFLFPPIALVRILLSLFLRKKKVEESKSDFELMKGNGIINKTLYKIFLSERWFILKGKHFPFGVSILCIGSKNEDNKD